MVKLAERYSAAAQSGRLDTGTAGSKMRGFPAGGIKMGGRTISSQSG